MPKETREEFRVRVSRELTRFQENDPVGFCSMVHRQPVWSSKWWTSNPRTTSCPTLAWLLDELEREEYTEEQSVVEDGGVRLARAYEGVCLQIGREAPPGEVVGLADIFLGASAQAESVKSIKVVLQPFLGKGNTRSMHDCMEAAVDSWLDAMWRQGKTVFRARSIVTAKAGEEQIALSFRRVES